MFVNGVDALRTGKHERYNDEEIHGLEPMTEIIEPDKCLEVLFGVRDDLVRRWFLIRFHIEQRFVKGEYKVMVIHAFIVYCQPNSLMSDQGIKKLCFA